jgi:glutamate 5-kinase
MRSRCAWCAMSSRSDNKVSEAFPLHLSHAPNSTRRLARMEESTRACADPPPSAVSTATLGTSLGTGGMSTKLIAADLATAGGTTTVIMHSENVRDIFSIVDGGVGPTREVPESETQDLLQGPLCTRFLRRETALKE